MADASVNHRLIEPVSLKITGIRSANSKNEGLNSDSLTVEIIYQLHRSIKEKKKYSEIAINTANE